ncbi:pentatricopeptide repeat-containing protein At2g40240, mitochondrial-like [Arachis stenosperma]|uniref:pentatricopeptide repeat-containing protein At2g40240, mitochondrial-like n=1 Tax=Arachis stenosperma TaxID=217475 RepID=UPI0025ABF7A9|nr:pentatricopeptide repeat-containing protein At2g40240, mitochondrial-like [Arachis stenosperma]
MSFHSKLLNKTLFYSLFTLRRFTTIATATAKQFPANPTSTSYDELTNAAGSSGDFHALRDALNKRIQDNCFNTKSTFNFVTDETFSSSLLNHLLQTLSALNRGVTRKNAFDSLITRLCKLQRVDDALHVIEYMARTDGGGCRPSATTFYPVLNLLTRQKAIDHARRVVDFMSTLGLNLDLTGHNYFLVAH